MCHSQTRPKCKILSQNFFKIWPVLLTKNFGSPPGAARKILQRGRKVTKHSTGNCLPLVFAVILTHVDYCNSTLVQLHSGATAASTLRVRAVYSGLAATGPHHSCTADTKLATCASTYYLQGVHTGAWCCLAFRYMPAYLLDVAVLLSTLPGRATYHRCHRRSVPEISSLLVCELGTSYPPLSQMDCVETFKRHLKTKLFMDVYCHYCVSE